MFKELKKSIKKYKKNNNWLYQVYKKNKDRIDDVMYNDRTSLTTFTRLKHLIIERIERLSGVEYTGGVDARSVNRYINKIAPNIVEKATKQIGNTELFTSKTERFQQNAYNAIKEFKKGRDLLRYADELGKKGSKIQPSDFVWSEKNKGYIFRNKVLVVFPNSSPFEPIFKKLEDNPVSIFVIPDRYI